MTTTAPLKISWSKIRAHDECHQKAALLAAGKKAELGDIRVYFPGTVADRLMRRWLNEDSPQAGQMASWLDEMLGQLEAEALSERDGVVRWRNPGDRDQVRAFVRELVTRLEPILGRLAFPFAYQPAARFETPLEIPGPDGEPRQILLVGEMDLLCKGMPPPEMGPQLPRAGEVIVSQAPAQWFIWDLKATRDAEYWHKTMAQMTFYAIACALMFGAWPHRVGLIQPMVDNRPVMEWVPGADDVNVMYARIIKTAHDIWRGDDSPKAGTEGCDWCPVRHACVRYQVVPGSRRVSFG